MRKLLSDTISLLCKNGLSYTQEFQIEGLLGITLDRKDVLLVNINELVSNTKNTDDIYEVDTSDYSCGNGDGNEDYDNSEDDTAKDDSAKDEIAVKQKNRSLGLQLKPEVESANIDLTQTYDITFSTDTRPYNMVEFEPPTKKAAVIEEEKEVAEVPFNKKEREADINLQSYTQEARFSIASQGNRTPPLLLQQAPSNLQQAPLNLQQAPANLMPTPASFMDTSSILDSSQTVATPQDFSNNSEPNTPNDDGRRQQQEEEEEEEEAPRSQSFKCDYQGCGSVLKSKRNWIRHKKTHFNIYPYQCPYCIKGLHTLQNVKRHLKVNHTGLFGFHCMNCRKGFDHVRQLKDHLQQDDCSVGSDE